MNAAATPPAAPADSDSGLGGKTVVIGIFVVALIAASSGLAYKYFASQQPLEMWGAEGIQIIQSAERVELLTFSADASPSAESTLQFGDQKLHIAERKDISKAQGLIHHRHFLTERVSYESPPVAASEQRPWTHAVRFQNDQGEVIVLFDLPNRRLANLQAHREVEVIPKIAENWQRFISRQLAGEKK